MKPVDKRALVEDLRTQLSSEIEISTQAAIATREGATHEDAKPENDKDTRAIEAGYLAGAQAERVRDLDKTRTMLGVMLLRDFRDGDAIALSALVTLSCDDAELVVFLAPAGGGMRAKIDGLDVQVVTPQSPMGQHLVGKTEGEEFEMLVQRRTKAYEIVGIR